MQDIFYWRRLVLFFFVLLLWYYPALSHALSQAPEDYLLLSKRSIR
jgi:hypothetical protein